MNNYFSYFLSYFFLTFLIFGSIHADDSIAIVRDKFGGTNPLDDRAYTQDPRYQRDLYNQYRDNQYRYNPYNNPSYYNSNVVPQPYTNTPTPYPNTAAPPPSSPYYPYGSFYFPPNADVNPDDTQFNQLYQRNQRSLGE